MGTWTIVGPTAPFKGGVAQHTTELAHRLDADGHSVVIESWNRQYPERLYPGDSQVSEDDHLGFSNTFRTLSWNRPDTWIRVGLRIRHRGGHVVLVGVTPFQFPIYLALLLLVSRQQRSSSVLIAHNVLPHEPSRVDGILVRLMYRVIGRVLTHSRKEQQHAEHLGAHADYAILPFHFDVEPATREPDREPTGLLAFIGYVRPYKGLDLLLEALSISDTDYQLEVLGEFWGGHEQYEDQIDRLSLSERVALRPGYAPTAEIIDLIDRADYLVLPYRSATSSQMPRLAFSRGTPVLATNAGDLSEQIKMHSGGIICEPTVHALSQALNRAWNNPLRFKPNSADIKIEWRNYLDTLHEAGRPDHSAV